MPAFLKRLSLGLLLIAGASAVLLMSDRGSRITSASAPVAGAAAPTEAAAPKPARHVRVALLQHASQLVLDQGRAGMLAGLAERGWVAGTNLDLKFYNAQGDMPVAQAIAKEMAGGGYDLLLSISTVSLQAVANANKAGKAPLVFGLVSDPYGAGVGINRDNHLDHPANLAGYGTMQPVALAFKIAREMNPQLKTVGVVWNAAEANSEAQLKLARAECAQAGITLLESTVDNSAGVAEAANALVARGVEALWMGGDVTVMSAVDSVIAAAKKGRIPVFTVIPPNAKRGALFDVGADYDEVGRLTGLLAGEILNGRSPGSVAIENVMPEMLTLNQAVVAGLKAKWTISEAMLQRAQLVIDAQGAEHAKAAAKPAGPASAALIGTPLPGRQYRIGLAAFAPEPSLDTCQLGLLDGLKALGFVEGGNLTVTRTHAQGEMVNIPPMIQNLDSTNVDAIVAFSTPVLQSTLVMAKHKPVVFTYVTDPLAAGVGKTYEDHAAHVTGIGSLPPIDDTVRILRRTMPRVKRLGTLYNSGEANSVKIISLLRESSRRAGLELVELTAASSNEVIQAMQALVARHIDAFYLPSDNTAYLAFDAIAKTCEAAKLPLIVDDADYVQRGAVFAAGPGYYESGKAAAPLLARVLLGESPAKIPMANVSVNTTKFNPAAIARLGLGIAPELIREIETGGTPGPATAMAAASAAAPIPASGPANPSGKKWKIALVVYNETPPTEQTLAGMKDAWRRSALVEGKDYELKLRSAQGDIAAVSGILDAAVTDGADIIVPISTPPLQVAAQKVKRTPIVFGLVANPMIAGAGKSYTDHLPNVTGIAVLAPVAAALDLVQKHFPAYKRLGTLFCPAEANSVDLKEALEAECRKRGITLEVVAANTASELPDAALALVGRPIDAILQLSDNLTSGGFTAITKAARQVKKPLISMNSTTVPLGSAVSLGRDYHNGGEAMVGMLEQVMRGESPASIPFALPPKIVYAASEENARAVGMTLPPELLREIKAANSTPPAAPAGKPTSRVSPAGKNRPISLGLDRATPSPLLASIAPFSP
jgi:putative tryptophan/tyrosine transport system substrate-binding protein